MRPAHSRHPTTHSLQQQGFNNEYGPQKGLTKHDFPNQGYTQYHAPQPVFSNHNGQPEPTKRRKSLLIGINYQGQARPLKGCRQDVHNMVCPIQIFPAFLEVDIEEIYSIETISRISSLSHRPEEHGDSG